MAASTDGISVSFPANASTTTTSNSSSSNSNGSRDTPPSPGGGGMRLSVSAMKLVNRPSFIDFHHYRFIIHDAPTDQNLPAYIDVSTTPYTATFGLSISSTHSFGGHCHIRY
jgi:hypothetical protein